MIGWLALGALALAFGSRSGSREAAATPGVRDPLEAQQHRARRAAREAADRRAAARAEEEARVAALAVRAARLLQAWRGVQATLEDQQARWHALERQRRTVWRLRLRLRLSAARRLARSIRVETACLQEDQDRLDDVAEALAAECDRFVRGARVGRSAETATPGAQAG